MKKLLMLVSCIGMLNNSISSMEMDRVKHRHRSDSETPVARMEAIDLEDGKSTGNNPIVMDLSGSGAVPALNLAQIEKQKQKQEMQELVEAALDAKFGSNNELHNDCKRALKKRLKELHSSPDQTKREALESLRQLSTERKSRRSAVSKDKVDAKADSSSGDSDKKSELHPDIETLITGAISDCIEQQKKHKWWAVVGGAAASVVLPILSGLMTAYLKNCSPIGGNTTAPA
jgi:hypothetical protein